MPKLTLPASIIPSTPPPALHSQDITMGLFSLLPESLETVETWIIRIFVIPTSLSPTHLPPITNNNPVSARGHNIRPVDSTTGLRHHPVHLAICHFRPAACWRPRTWTATAASCSKPQGTPRWAQAASQHSWRPCAAASRLPPSRRPCCHHSYLLGFWPQTQHHRHHESSDL